MKVVSVNGAQVRFECHYNSADTKEDQAFSEATPSGHMELYVSNPTALAILKEGDYCHIDITPIVVPEKAEG